MKLHVVDTQLMRETTGSLLWLSNCTRPDITMAVNYLARFITQPTIGHWRAVKHLLRYLKGTPTTGIYFQHGHQTHTSVKPVMYLDADWAGDQEDAKSTFGGVLTINGAPITWYSKKQSTVALSTAEAEYIAAGTAVRDCLWIQQLLNGLRLHPESSPVYLHVDNQSAIKLWKRVDFPADEAH
ncbi:unnamed protein product [Phytophthora lilii]|uniref:Unnamed protein product n=1 Tax=Phytophthora lilii TaxID=2077276 RepID=A0A9W6WPI5_9STRA|nr:unnamed protein product [Phytophthora lilii]